MSVFCRPPDFSAGKACIVLNVTAGSGEAIASGQTASKAANDPAAHIAVQGL